MYRISELAKKVGLSRSTLLYYEKLGLITSNRGVNRYRYYSDQDVQRIRLLQQLQAGGLTLNECLECLETRVDKDKLLYRLKILDEEIIQKQNSRKLLASMLGLAPMKEWHQEMEKQAPQAHFTWLKKQGFSEKQALRLKWLSKDMNEHDQYMADFEHVFEGIDLLGPGSIEDTLKAFDAIPLQEGRLLDIGCGKGSSSLTLAENSQFMVTALDNDEYSLSCLNEKLETLIKQNVPKTICASMSDLPFEKQQFDVIWSEGSAYIIGVSKALESWKQFIKPDGYLVISDLVWLTHSPDQEALDFWQENYADMSTVAERTKMMKNLGYHLVDTFKLSMKAWDNYLEPLKDKLERQPSITVKSKALFDLNRELIIHQKYLGQYGYQIFVLKREN